MPDVLRIDQAQLHQHLDRIVRDSVEQTLNALLDAEADQLCGAKRYERSPDRVSGAWVFRGTRVPVKALFENLESGARLEEFLEWFPGVAREQPVRDPPALLEPRDRLARPPARRDHAVVVVEHDDGLAALFEEHPAAGRVGVHAHGVLTDA